LLGDPLPSGAIARLGTTRLHLGNRVLALVVSPDSRTIAAACAYRGVYLLEAGTGKKLHWLRQKGKDRLSVERSYEPFEQKIHIYEALTGKLRTTLEGHKEQVYALAFSPDGRWLVSGSKDSTVLVWDLTPRASANSEAGSRRRLTRLGSCYEP
jgi:WD40 repeat protein